MLAQLCSHLGWSDRRMSHCVSVWPALNRSEPYTVKSSRALLVLVVSLLTFITGAVLMRNPFRRARVNGVQNQLPTPLLTSQLGPTEVWNWAEISTALIHRMSFLQCTSAVCSPANRLTESRGKGDRRLPWFSKCNAHSCRYKRAACSHLYKECSSDGLCITPRWQGYQMKVEHQRPLGYYEIWLMD